MTLSRLDRVLLQAHGYPFSEVEAELSGVPATVDLAELAFERFDIEQMLGDLAWSINHCSNRDLQERLDELYECIELDSSR